MGDLSQLHNLRSLLFVPADRPERFAKAAGAGADAVILDLEDAVAPEAKSAARAHLASRPAGRIILRINAEGTEPHEADVAALAGGGFAAVMLPKAEDPVRVAALAARTGLPVIALVETALGLSRAAALAQAAGVARLAFGSIDFCADLGCAHTREALLYPRHALVMASRLAGLPPPIDGVTTQLKDPAATQSDARYARDLGMGGKLCIHPAQVAWTHAAFAPSEAEVIWARRVMAAQGGAVAVDGEMVDAPVRLRAQAILHAADAGG